MRAFPARRRSAAASGHGRRGAAFGIAWALLHVLPCAAANHIVTVEDGFPPNHIVPSQLTVAAGDSVTFRASGNNETHNVHADNDAFRCALGCRGDAGGATGNATKKDWSDTLVFGAPGSVPYHCDTHPGATARIDVVAGQPIAGGTSGNWFDPAPEQSGHGFQIEVLPDNGIVAIWFVFNPTGTAQSWIYAQGSYDPGASSVTIPAYLGSGGAFPPSFDAGKVTFTPWGTLAFSFGDCNNGTFTFEGSAAAHAAGYGDITFAIQRLTHIAGTTCP